MLILHKQTDLSFIKAFRRYNDFEVHNKNKNYFYKEKCNFSQMYYIS